MHAIVHSADIQDRDGGALVMATMFGMFPFLLKLYADGGYRGPLFRAAVAILNVGGVHDGVHQQALRIDEDVTLLALDLLASVIPRRIAAPLFQRF